MILFTCSRYRLVTGTIAEVSEFKDAAARTSDFVPKTGSLLHFMFVNTLILNDLKINRWLLGRKFGALVRFIYSVPMGSFLESAIVVF